MKNITKIIKIFNDTFSYENINANSPIKMRNKTNGVTITDAIYHRFSYAHNNTTQQSIASHINKSDALPGLKSWASDHSNE